MHYLNEEPMFLISTTNRKMAELFQAERGTSLLTGNATLSGLMMYVSPDGTVISSNGKELFKMSAIQNVENSKGMMRIRTQNSKYIFRR